MSEQPTIDLPNPAALLERMVFCRQFELLVERLALAGEVRGMAHLGIGQEAIAAGISPLLTERDWINGTYRNVTLAIYLGTPMTELLGELLGKKEGLCGGHGGHMHLFDLPRRFLGTDPVVGSAMALGAGAALALKFQRLDGVALSFFGEGALGTGISHEVLNIAKLWNLPILFVVENNGYAISTPIEASLATPIFQRSRSYGIPSESVDGNDIHAVHNAASKLLNLVRSERTPALLEARTYRHRGHSKSDGRAYRTREEEHQWSGRDPIKLLAERIGQTDAVSELTRAADAKLTLALEVARAMKEGAMVPLAQPQQYRGLASADTVPASTLQEPHRPGSEDTAPASALAKAQTAAPEPVAPPPIRNPPGFGETESPPQSAIRNVSYRQALNEALSDALASDERTVFFGQDVGVFGGAYKASIGLQERFGKDRVIDTPIAELGVCEILTGAAVCGMKPIFEVMFGDFLALAADAIVNHAAKFRFVSGGKVKVPLIVRAPYGPGNGFGATHSQSVERWFAHVPGLIVAVPSTPADVKQMLLGALRCDDPVLLLEPIGLYANTGPVPEVVEPSLTGARVVAAGSRVTVVSYGRALFAALAAREKLADPSQIEVIDLRCLVPLDRETLIESARKTGALLVVEDDPKTFGIGGEIVASVVEAGVALRQVCRLAGADASIGFSPALEGAAFPNTQQIVDVLRQFM